MKYNLEAPEMIIPESLDHSVREGIGTESTSLHSLYIKDGHLLERAVVVGKRRVETTSYANSSKSASKRYYETTFDIIKVLYVTFTPKTPEDYLCLIGETHIDFYALADNQYCSLAIPFKIWDAHACNMGILLERNCFSDWSLEENPPDASQLFSLTHPYNEIFPVLCKFREKSEMCQYAFRNRRMCVVPSCEGVARSSAYANLVLVYDLDERVSHLFYVRRCTKEERLTAKEELLLNGYGGLVSSIHTPASIQSFYSPNFFHRRFGAQPPPTAEQPLSQLQSIVGTLGGRWRASFGVQPPTSVAPNPLANQQQQLLPTTTQPHEQSPALPTASTIVAARVITPLRRSIRTRSMLAAIHNESLAFASSIGGCSIGDTNTHSNSRGSLDHRRSQDSRAPPRHSEWQQSPADGEEPSAEAYGNLSRRVINPLRMEEGRRFASRGEFTPKTKAEWEDSGLLSLGKDDSGMSLDCSVEFCLEWLWSEKEEGLYTHASPIPIRAISQLQVSSTYPVPMATPPIPFLPAQVGGSTNSPWIRNERDGSFGRKPEVCFATTDIFGQHYFIFNITGQSNSPRGPENVLKMLRVKWKDGHLHVAKYASFPNMVAVTPMPCSRFFVALERSHHSPYSEEGMARTSSTRLALFSGMLRIGNIAADSVDSKGDAAHLQQEAIERLAVEGTSAFYCVHSRQVEEEVAITLPRQEEGSSSAEPVAPGGNERKQDIQRVIKDAETVLRLLLPGVDPTPALGDENERKSQGRSDEPMPGTSTGTCRVGLRLAMSTRKGEAVLAAMVGSFHRREEKEKFVVAVLSANLWKTEESIMDMRVCEELTQARIEISMLVEVYLSVRKPVAISSPLQEQTVPMFLHRQILQLRMDFDSMECDGSSTSKRSRRSSRESLNNEKYLDLLQQQMRIESSFDAFLAAVTTLLPGNVVTAINAPCPTGSINDGSTRHESPPPTYNGEEPEASPAANGGGGGLREFPAPSEAKRWTSARWSADIRVENVAQMFDSSLPILIPHKQATSDAQLREQQEQFLFVTAPKTLTRPFGQAILQYRCKEKTSERETKPICLSGKADPGRMQIEFPASEATTNHKHSMEWAEFYNAVAHGLSVIDLECDFRDLYQAADSAPPTKAGLAGSMRSVGLYDIHECLARGDKFLAMALLLGCAISNRGTSSVHIYKVLSTHLPFLLAPTLCEFKIPSVVQCSALISLGILFMETMNASLTNKLLNEMSKETFDSEQSSERYAYVLNAGFAVGLINLGKGREITDTEIPIADSRYSAKERLLKLLNGGLRERCTVLFDKKVCSPQISETSSVVSQQQHEGAESASCVRELASVNIHLGSPAACAALALMYMRTGDRWIVDALEVPNTICDVERIRPDVLMLRVAAKCLVLPENALSTTMEWVEQQVPEIIRKYVKHYFNYRNPWWETFVDMSVVAQAYFYCATGACFAMALRYASEWDLAAKKTILNLYSRMQVEGNMSHLFSRLCMKAGRNCLDACVNVCAISLGILMAGSGDLESIRILRKIRNTIPRLSAGHHHREPRAHSLHSFTNMALGLTLMGSGRHRFMRSNFALASLFISFFPVFPQSLMDNRVYLQVARFLWTMAVDKNVTGVEEHREKARLRGVT